MLSRVTQAALLRDLLGQVGRLQRRLGEVQRQVATQKKLLSPSDDPEGSARVGRLRSQVSDIRSLQDSVGFGLGVLGTEDSALGQAHDLIVRAQEIASRQSGDLVTPDQRRRAAVEVAEIERSLIGLANTSVGGRHVFGGLATGDPPFAQLDDPGFDPSNPYSGPSEAFSIRTGEDQALTRITTPGDQVFGGAIAALDDLRVSLEAGSPPVASQDALAAAAETLRAERSSVGGRSRQLLEQVGRLRTARDGAKERAGKLEDADLTEVVVELAQLQNALQATLESGRVLQTSILDQIRL